jgi:hypothetical protein
MSWRKNYPAISDTDRLDFYEEFAAPAPAGCGFRHTIDVAIADELAGFRPVVAAPVAAPEHVGEPIVASASAAPTELPE